MSPAQAVVPISMRMEVIEDRIEALAQIHPTMTYQDVSFGLRHLALSVMALREDVERLEEDRRPRTQREVMGALRAAWRRHPRLVTGDV